MISSISNSMDIPLAELPDRKTIGRELESHFLAEMLKHSGVDSSGGTFDGPGEWRSFLLRARADGLAARGIGLAEHFNAALLRDEGSDG